MLTFCGSHRVSGGLPETLRKLLFHIRKLGETLVFDTVTVVYFSIRISEKEEKDKPAVASTHKREEIRKEAGYCDCCSIKFDDLEKVISCWTSSLLLYSMELCKNTLFLCYVQASWKK